MRLRFVRLAMCLLPLLADAACSKSEFEFKPAVVEGPTEPLGIQSTPDSQLRLATRSYVGSSLRDIFGDTKTVTDLVSTYVDKQVSTFGGEPCDPNGGDCNEAGESQLPMVPFIGSQRLALTMRVCQRLTLSDEGLAKAAENAAGATKAGMLNSPTDADITNAFDLFYTGRPISAEVLTDLRGVVEAAAREHMSARDQWRFLLTTLCESPGWQIL